MVCVPPAHCAVGGRGYADHTPESSTREKSWISPRRLGTGFLAAALFGSALGLPASSQTTKDQAKPKAKAKAQPTRPPLPPTHGNVPYGDHPRQVLDFYKAETEEPAPLVVFIHGGGWVNGDKYGIGDPS